jgi:hypothetical protein
MPDPTLNEAIQEAYASATPDKLMIDTLSIYYDGLVNDLDQPAELYLFDGNNPTSVTDAGVPLLLAKIEDTAPRAGGEMVTFIGVPFSITLPEMSTEAAVSAALQIDNVGREASDLLAAAAQGGKAITVTYRNYRAGAEASGPQNIPPRVFTLYDAEAAAGSVTGRLGFLSIGNRRFPFEPYRPDRFRTLQYA